MRRFDRDVQREKEPLGVFALRFFFDRKANLTPPFGVYIIRHGEGDRNMKQREITVGKRIREYRRERRLSQEVFGELIGVSAQAVSKWERELSYPDITLLPILAGVVGCSIDAFFE